MNKIILLGFAIIVLITGGYFYFNYFGKENSGNNISNLQNTKKNGEIITIKKEEKNINYFYEKFPEFKKVCSNNGKCIESDNINPNKEICIETPSENGKVLINCFIPSEYEKYIEGFDDKEKFEQILKKGKIVNIKQQNGENKDPYLKFLDKVVYPNPDKLDDTYLQEKKEIFGKIQSGKYEEIDLQKYIYINSLEGNYDELNKSLNLLCTKYKKYCSGKKQEIIISGEIKGDNGAPLEGVKIEILGNNKSIITGKSGKYFLKFDGVPYMKGRIKASKDGYSIGVYSFNIVSRGESEKFEKDFTLTKAENFVKINTKNNTIEGDGASIQNENFIIKTNFSEYIIPFGAIVTKKGIKYNGKVNVYLFEFNKSSNLDDLLSSDIFDDVVGYAGNIMKTFGMPFIIFVGENGENLHILKSNPMILTTKIQEMEALKNDKDRIYGPLTDQDIDFIYNVSQKNKGYPIDRFLLAKYDVLRFPAFWIFDQYKGVWENVGVRLISKDGICEVPFYTISNIEN